MNLLVPGTLQCVLMAAIVSLLFFKLSRWLPILFPAGAGNNNKGAVVVRPPEPAGAWPLVGHLPLLAAGKEMAARTLGRMADEHGPIFMLRLGVNRTLVISSQEAARECFTTYDKLLADRPATSAGKYLGYNYTMFGFAPYGPHWRQMRKIATVELLSHGRLEKLRRTRAAEIGARMRELYDELCAKEDGRPEVEMKHWFEDTTFNVITSMVVGPGRCRQEDVRGFQRALTSLLYLTGVFVPSDAIPWLERLDLQGYIKAMKRISKELDVFLDGWVEDHRRRRISSECSMAEEGDQDFIDVLLSAVGCSADQETHTAIKGTVLAMMLGGTDTSAITMTWALTLLLNHPRVLSKVRQELELKVGDSRNVEEADVGKLVYLQAVMKETMRLYPVAPLSVPHEASADVQIGGFHVPAGTRLLTNLWKLHRDPRVWEDPLEFRPERFLAGKGAALDVRGNNFEYLPFGSGRRICPGITFALQVTQLTMARLLHGFEVATPDGQPADMGEGLGLNITKAMPLDVLLTPRLPPHLYR